MDIARAHVLICAGTGCTSSKSEQIAEEMQKQLNDKGLENEVKIVKTGCFGLCALGPIMIVYPEGAFYSKVTVDDVEEIVEEHLLKGRIVKRLLYDETVQEDNIKSLNVELDTLNEQYLNDEISFNEYLKVINLPKLEKTKELFLCSNYNKLIFIIDSKKQLQNKDILNKFSLVIENNKKYSKKIPGNYKNYKKRRHLFSLKKTG